MAWADALAGAAPWLGACLFLLAAIVAVKVTTSAATARPAERARLAEAEARIEGLERLCREALDTAEKARKIASTRKARADRAQARGAETSAEPNSATAPASGSPFQTFFDQLRRGPARPSAAPGRVPVSIEEDEQ